MNFIDSADIFIGYFDCMLQIQHDTTILSFRIQLPYDSHLRITRQHHIALMPLNAMVWRKHRHHQISAATRTKPPPTTPAILPRPEIDAFRRLALFIPRYIESRYNAARSAYHKARWEQLRYFENNNTSPNTGKAISTMIVTVWYAYDIEISLISIIIKSFATIWMGLKSFRHLYHFSPRHRTNTVLMITCRFDQ